MVRHIVLWKLKETAADADRKQNAIKLKKMLEALGSVVPGAYKMEVGLNYSPGGYDVALVAEFNDHEALEDYTVHPEYLRVAQFIKKIAAERAVADYMI